MTDKTTTKKPLNIESFISQNKKFKENPELMNEYIETHLKNSISENSTEENAKIKKILHDENFKKDISADQDLTIALMNLIGIEEHLFFTGAKTENHEYYDLITVIRDIRKSLLGSIIKEYEGEVWCISKHLLASSYRLMEVGTKQLDLGRKEEAYELFDKSFNLYCLFWGINKKIFATPKEKINPSDKPDTKETILDKIKNFTKTKKKHEYVVTVKDENIISPEITGVMNKFKNFVKKVVDCCIE